MAEAATRPMMATSSAATESPICLRMATSGEVMGPARVRSRTTSVTPSAASPNPVGAVTETCSTSTVPSPLATTAPPAPLTLTLARRVGAAPARRRKAAPPLATTTGRPEPPSTVTPAGTSKLPS